MKMSPNHARIVFYCVLTVVLAFGALLAVALDSATIRSKQEKLVMVDNASLLEQQEVIEARVFLRGLKGLKGHYKADAALLKVLTYEIKNACSEGR